MEMSELNKRELWLIEWIAKSEARQDLWDLELSEVLTIVMREWIKQQFDHYPYLRAEAKRLQDAKKSIV